MKKHLYCLIGLALATALLVPISAFADEEPEPNENPEPTFIMTFDFNGGATFDGKGTFARESVSYGPILNEPFLVSCIVSDSNGENCRSIDIKKGKELDYVTVNGEHHEVGEEDGFIFNQDTVIKYFWTDVDLPSYTIESEDGDVITFDEEEGHEFHLNLNKFSFSMTDEQLEEIGISREEYEAGKATIAKAVENYGPTILYVEIEIYDEEDRPITQGPFEIKIKYSEDMVGFDSYKLIYIEMDDEGNVITTEESTTLTLDESGEYLVGTLEHISGYALVGVTNVPGAPDTGFFIESPSATSSLLTVFGTIILASIIVAYRKN